MQALSSLQLSIELEDLNSVETAYEPSLNDLGLQNWKPGHGHPALPCVSCCSCSAASMGDSHSE